MKICEYKIFKTLFDIIEGGARTHVEKKARSASMIYAIVEIYIAAICHSHHSLLYSLLAAILVSFFRCR